MRLLVVTSSFPRFQGDIAGRFVLEWCDHLAQRGHTLRVLTWHDSAAAGAPLDAGVDVARVPYAPPGLDTLFYGAGTPENLRENPLRAWLAAPAGAAMLTRITWELSRFRPNLLIGHWLIPAGLLVRTVGKLSGLPTLVVGHSGGVHLLDRLPGPVGRALAKFVLSGPTTVASRPLADKLHALAAAPAPTTVLPMGFEPPPMPNTPRCADWLCMGRLVDIKGVDLAIDAFARADLPGTPTLHIAGDGPERASLERRAAQQGAHVEFHGFVTGAAKERLWAQCGYMLLTSKTLADGRHEGLPVSFLEAASRGIVPLCAPIPGLGTHLGDCALQQVDGRDPAVWARRIEALAGLDTGERAQLAERQHAAVAQLDWTRLIKRWDRLIAQCVG